MSNLDMVIEESHRALGEFVKGNAAPFQDLYSLREDVTLANPFGSVVRGKKAVTDALALAATRFREGVVVGYENLARYVVADLACIVEIERYVAKFAGRDQPEPLALRVTSVFRREGGSWKVIARHADPRVELQPLGSVFSK